MIEMHYRSHWEQISTVIPVDEIGSIIVSLLEQIPKFLVSEFLHIKIDFYYNYMTIYSTRTEWIRSFRLFLKI